MGRDFLKSPTKFYTKHLNVKQLHQRQGIVIKELIISLPMVRSFSILRNMQIIQVSLMSMASILFTLADILFGMVIENKLIVEFLIHLLSFITRTKIILTILKSTLMMQSSLMDVLKRIKLSFKGL